MGKAISILSHNGEIGREGERIHYPGYDFTEWGDDNEKTEWYEVDITLIQDTTSTELRVVKEFENLVSAKNYALKFIEHNPLCELVIRRKTTQEVFYYV